MTRRLENRIALITGASRGIGAAVAKSYAKEGAHVILIARTVGALEELDDEIQADGGTATLVPLDLMDGAAIDGLAAPLLERWNKLDILVGNAAILGKLTPLAHYPPDGWEDIFKINVHANWRLIRALDPLLRASDAGRVLFVTTGATRSLPAYWGGYSVTKAAVEAMAVTYAKEVAKTPLRVNLINPGGTRTQMRAAAFPGEDPETLPRPEDIVEPFIRAVEASFDETGQWIPASDWDKRVSLVS
jgi:NAD(P)-dependent dehydrogenase (short-subunit alcohol dehydrogenase family)